MSRVSHGVDRVWVSFDEPNLVANAGLLLVGTLVVRLELERLVNATVRLSGRVGGAHPGRKVLTLVHAMVAGASHIDHADMLRSGETDDVAADFELAESLSIAMLTVLETLGPGERAVFGLRAVLEVPYDEDRRGGRQVTRRRPPDRSPSTRARRCSAAADAGQQVGTAGAGGPDPCRRPTRRPARPRGPRARRRCSLPTEAAW